MVDTSDKHIVATRQRFEHFGSVNAEDAYNLFAKIAELEAREQLWREYVAFLFEANRGPVTMAHAHHWRCPDEDIKRGEQFRKDLGIAELEVS